MARAHGDTGLLGATAAAAYLGISRTTLHRESKQGNLAPDVVTRGGQRRYRMKTLEDYTRRHLAHGQPADDAPSPADANRWEAIGEIARLTGSNCTVAEICNGALRVVYAAFPGAEFAYVVIAKPPMYDLLEMQRYGYGELEPALMEVFEALGPRAGYLTPRLISRGETVRFDDMMGHPMLRGSESEAFALQFGVRSFLAVPLKRDGVPIGLLGIGSRMPHLFRTRDVPYASAAADVLVSALTAHAIRKELSQAHIAIARLAAEGLRLQPADGRSIAEETHAQLVTLIDLFRTNSGAHAVGIRGLGHDVIPAHEQLASLMRTATTPGQMALCPPGSMERGEVCTCLAIGVARPDGTRGTVGAAWHGQRQFTAQDSALFTAFASLCLLTTSLLS
jgi:hypothetical protein